MARPNANAVDVAKDARAATIEPNDTACGRTDPTKDPEFQKVVRHFLSTPPQPHKTPGKRKATKVPRKDRKITKK
jgi:hypothetical protein